MAEEGLTAQYAELRRAIRKENYDRAVKLANELMTSCPDDEDLVKCKCVALIHLEDYGAALKVAKDGNLEFEQAYCLYKQKAFDHALEVVRASSAPDSERMRHVEGQCLYALQQAEEAVDVFQKLHDDSSDPSPELTANACAAYVVAGRASEGIENLDLADGDAPTTYEMSYNLACALLACRNYGKAESTLRTAEGQCRRMLMEEAYSPEDIDEEVAVVQVQRAFALLMQGKVEEPLKICNRVLKTKPADEVVGAVAANNLAVLRKDRELFDSHKRLQSAIRESVEAKLLPSQLDAVRFNRCLLLLHMNKVEECRQSLSNLLTFYPDTVQPRLIDAALKLRDKKQAPQVLRQLEELAEATSDVAMKGEVDLFRAQLLLKQGKQREAAEVLEAIEIFKGYPGTVATLVSLYTGLGDEQKAEAVMTDAFSSLDSRSMDDGAKTRLMEEVAAFKLKKGDYEEAAEVYEQLLSGDVALEAEERLKAVAHLVIACSWFDQEAAEEHAMSLPALESMEDMDPEELESTEVPRSSRARRLVVVDKAQQRLDRKKAGIDPAKRLEKRARLREKYLKKLEEEGKYDPRKPTTPDAERWVAKKSRSYNKRNRKDRNRNKFSGAQGAGEGTAKDAAKLDAFARAQARKEAELKAEELPPGAKGKAGRKPYKKLR